MAGRRVGPIAVLALCAVLPAPLGATGAPLAEDMAKRPQDCVDSQCAQPEARLADSLLALKHTLVKEEAVDEEISGLPGGLNFAQRAGLPVIIAVGVRQGWMVDSVRFNFSNGLSELYPFYGTDGNGGSAAPAFLVNPGEYISEVRGRAGDHLDMIQFVTQTNRTSSEYGGQGGSAFVLRAPAGQSIVGLSNMKSRGKMSVGMVLAALTDNHHEECWSNQQAKCRDDGAEVCPWCGTHGGNSMYCCHRDWTYPPAHNCYGADFASAGAHRCVVGQERHKCESVAGHRCGSSVGAVCGQGRYCSSHGWCGSTDTHNHGLTKWSDNYGDVCA